MLSCAHHGSETKNGMGKLFILMNVFVFSWICEGGGL